MTKEEIRKYLVEKGASSDLLSKPAVFERILACFDAGSYYGVLTGNFYEIVKPIEEVAKVDEDGNISINDGANSRSFKRMPNNQALYVNNDETGFSIDDPGEYLIDKYGMDVKYTDPNGETIERKENGIIKVAGYELKDTGSPILNTYDLINAKDDKAWAKNRKEILKKYPGTLQWFLKRDKMSNKEKQQVSQIPEKNVKELKQKIDELEKENQKLKDELSNLKHNMVPKEELDTLKTEKRKTEIERNILKIQKQEVGEKNKTLTKEKQAQTTQIEQLNSKVQVFEQNIVNLKERNKNLQKMLQQSLTFCKIVQSSFLGRILFGRKLKQLPPASEDTK